MFSKFFFENRTVYEIMSKNSVKPELATNDATTWRIRVACSKSKVTCTHTPIPPGTRTHPRARPHTHTHARTYIILIDFPRQQWSRELASILRYMHFACLFILVSHLLIDLPN
jgi:hypothetical protein